MKQCSPIGRNCDEQSSAEPHLLRAARARAGARARMLMRDWDPICVGDEPLAQDEYDEYARRVVQMLRQMPPPKLSTATCERSRRKRSGCRETATGHAALRS